MTINKKLQKGLSSVWILSIVVLAAILSVIIFNISRRKSNSEPDRVTFNVNSDTQTTITIKSSADNPETVVSPIQSRYMIYSPAAFESATSQKRVLYFHASWCPVCRPIDIEFQQKADQIPSGVVVFKTDYDSESKLKNKYAITYQHTFVQVDSEGNEITKWNGGGLSEVIARVK